MTVHFLHAGTRLLSRPMLAIPRPADIVELCPATGEPTVYLVVEVRWCLRLAQEFYSLLDEADGVVEVQLEVVDDA